jgi:hypothetical protein
MAEFFLPAKRAACAARIIQMLQVPQSFGKVRKQAELPSMKGRNSIKFMASPRAK